MEWRENTAFICVASATRDYFNNRLITELDVKSTFQFPSLYLFFFKKVIILHWQCRKRTNINSRWFSFWFGSEHVRKLAKILIIVFRFFFSEIQVNFCRLYSKSSLVFFLYQIICKLEYLEKTNASTVRPWHNPPQSLKKIKSIQHFYTVFLSHFFPHNWYSRPRNQMHTPTIDEKTKQYWHCIIWRVTWHSHAGV